MLSTHVQRFQSCCSGKWPQGISVSLCPSPVTGGSRALAKVLFLDCQLEWNVLEETPKACVPFFLPSFPLCPGHIPAPAAQLSGGGSHHRWGDPKEGSWRWEPHHLETWGPGGFSKLFQPRSSTSFGCSRNSFTAPTAVKLPGSGGCGLVQRGTDTPVHGAGFIDWHILPTSLSPKTVHQETQACPGFRDVAAAQVTKAWRE